MGSKKKRGAKILFVILAIIVGIPLIAAGSSFIGRISPGSIIPDSFNVYAIVPDPARFLNRVINHRHLPDILALAELAPFLPEINKARASGISENIILRQIAKGRLDSALLSDGRMLAAWDAGIMSPFLRILPGILGRFGIPGLYYVQAGKNSRFEYRLEDGTVLFAGFRRNLLVIANNSELYNAAVSGGMEYEDKFAAAEISHSRDFDIAFFVSPDALANLMEGGEEGGNKMASVFDLLQFPGHLTASIRVLPDLLRFRFVSPLDSEIPALKRIIERDSRVTQLEAAIPAEAQYLTLISAGSLEELLAAASAITPAASLGNGIDSSLRTADAASRRALGMSLEELLFSWSGSQFAVYGLEGRPNPVIAIEVQDEAKRAAVFNRAFRSIFINENIQTVLDGQRIARIQLPGYLNILLQIMNIHVPSPYYLLHDNYLFISESAESLLISINAARRSDVLPRTDIWRNLSEGSSGPASFSLYYSLDRSLPFFLQGSSTLASVLRLYRQGLLRLHLEGGIASLNLHVVPGVLSGLVAVPGYPVDLPAGERTGNRLYKVSSGTNTRLIMTSGNNVLSVNPLTRAVKEMAFPGTQGSSLFALPASDENGSNQNGEIWVVNSRGNVSLVNGDLENLSGFPISTGINLSAPPAAWGGRLFLSSEDGSVFTVDSRSRVNIWGSPFFGALRSPPSFIEFENRTIAGVYPKSFFGEIFLLDSKGDPLPNWPLHIPGIAFGSPELFAASDSGRGIRLLAAFITQSGELAVYGENAEAIPGFPVNLEGVFYLQPVFDGEFLWAIESTGILYSVSLAGNVKSEKIPRLSAMEESYITAINSGLSGAGGIFISGEGNALHGFSRNFNSLEGFPLPVWGKPVFGDFDGSGKTGIAGIGMDNRLYMWQSR